MPIPGNLTTIVVTGTLLDPSGAAVAGSVSFAAPAEISDAAGAALISPVPYVATLVAGSFSVTLPCTDNTALSPTGWAYTVTINLTALGQSQAYSIPLPHTLGASVDLSQLLPAAVVPTPSGNAYALLAASNLWAGIQSYQQATNGIFQQANVSGDTAERYTADTSGKIQWGPGNAALDTDLYRSGVGALKTDGAFTVVGQFTGTGVGITDWIDATAAPYNATGNGTSDDTTAIQAALNACRPGGTVFLRNTGNPYRTNAPLTIPPAVTLRGSTYDTLQLTGGSGEVPAYPRIKPLASFSGNGVIEMLSMTPGGYSAESAQQRVYDLFVDCTALSGSTINGVYFQGPVYGVQMERVYILDPPHDGIQMASQAETGITNTMPYHMRLRDVVVQGAGAYGFSLSATTDSDFVQCLAFACVSGGWLVQSTMANQRFLGCRAEWTTTGHGFQLTGNVTSGVSLVDCSTDNNNSHGVYINGATGAGTITINGLRANNDGHNGTSGGGSFAGLAVIAATCNVVASDVSTAVGNAATASTPQYGVRISGSTFTAVTSGLLQGNTQGFLDDGTNTIVRRGANIREQTGSFGSLAAVDTNGFQVDSLGLTWAAEGGTVLSVLPGDLTPEELGFILATDRLSTLSATGTWTSGTIYAARVAARQAKTISNLTVNITTAASGLTAGLLGIYDTSGNQKAITSDQSTAWASTGSKTAALTSSFTVTKGAYYYLMGIAVGATGPTMMRTGTGSGSPSFFNLGSGASTFRWGTLASQSTLPGTVTLSSFSASSFAYGVIAT